MSEVVHQGSGELPSLADRRAASAAQTAFEHSYNFEWAHLPSAITGAVNDAEAPVAAIQLDTDDPSVRRRRDSGEFWQPATIWRATQSGVTLLRLRRILRKSGPRRYSPTGELALDGVDFKRAAEPPTRRNGLITEPPGRTGEPGGEATTVSTEDYLPAVVVAEMTSVVPTPSYRHDVFLQYTSSRGLPYHQRIELIRLGIDRGVVVTASRALETLPTGIDAAGAQRLVALEPWDVTRYAYKFGVSGTDPVVAT